MDKRVFVFLFKKKSSNDCRNKEIVPQKIFVKYRLVVAVSQILKNIQIQDTKR